MAKSKGRPKESREARRRVLLSHNDEARRCAGLRSNHNDDSPVHAAFFTEGWFSAVFGFAGAGAAGLASAGFGFVVISKSSVRKGVTGSPSLEKRLHTGLSA